VHAARDELLAGAALAPHEDGDVGVRDLLDDLPDVLHRTVVAAVGHDVVLGAGAAAERLDLAPERPVLEGLLERELELLDLEGLAQEVARAEAHRLDDRARLAVAGEHDHGHVGQALLQLAQGLEPVHALEHHVEGHEVGPRALERAQRVLAARNRDHVVPLARHQDLQVLAYPRIVIDDQHAERLRHGSTQPPLPG
jgi:hypothetical protein